MRANPGASHRRQIRNDVDGPRVPYLVEAHVRVERRKLVLRDDISYLPQQVWRTNFASERRHDDTER